MYPCSHRSIPCFRSQRIHCQVLEAGRELGPPFGQTDEIREDFPVSPLLSRDSRAETSSPQTPPTAIESVVAETPPKHLVMAREIPAIRRLGSGESEPETADYEPPRAVISVGKLGGSESLKVSQAPPTASQPNGRLRRLPSRGSAAPDSADRTV